MNNLSLKSLAWACKILAIAASVVLPLILHPRWGVNRIADVQVVGLAVLSLTPNRWLVFSRISFVIFLLLALYPFSIFFHISAYRDFDLQSVTAMILCVLLFAPLPLSLVLSRIRFHGGDKFTYALHFFVVKSISNRSADRGAIKTEMSTNEPGWIKWLLNHPPFFVLYFIAVWALVSYLIGQLSGWSILSRRFRDTGAFYSYQWAFQSFRLGTLCGKYSNCANLGADETGLYLAVFPLFRIGHPTLFIPWPEIQVLSGNRGLIFKKRELLLGRQESIPLVVSVALAEKLKEAAGQAWPVETIDT